MHCRQLHHINSGFYTTVSCSLYPHLAPTSVHPCPSLPYISFNYRHRSTASVILLLTLIETLMVCFLVFCFFLGIQLWLNYWRAQTQTCLSPPWSRQMLLYFSFVPHSPQPAISWLCLCPIPCFLMFYQNITQFPYLPTSPSWKTSFFPFSKFPLNLLPVMHTECLAIFFFWNYVYLFKVITSWWIPRSQKLWSYVSCWT